MRTRVKVCCISSVQEARQAVAHGADALGLVSAMPSGPGVIDEAAIASIARAVPPPVSTFLLTSATTPEAIVEQQTRCRATALQLVDAVDPAVYPALRNALPAVRLVQVVHVEDESALATARQAAAHVDAVLLDSGRPSGGDDGVAELGGTGRTHNWDVSRRIVEAADVPVFLAGGLDAENVQDAIRHVRPFGLDLCSGLRTNGALDVGKLRRFMDGVHAADARRREA